MNTQFFPPAQIWVGKPQTLCHAVHTFAQNIWCSLSACGSCITCTQIQEHQHHGLMWLSAENSYTLEDIAIIHTTQALTLEPGTHLFFIIQKADYLTPACTNSLLKLVEEPPSGYHFIFLTERPEKLLPTIRSRCTKRVIQNTATQTLTPHPLMHFFTNTLAVSPVAFIKELDASAPNERTTLELLDEILQFWLTEYKNAYIKDNKSYSAYAQRVVNLIITAMEKPPMPGSSKIFWKNLILCMSVLKKNNH